MSVEAPYPELDEYLVWIGEAGWRISEIEASEGSAGNISVCIGWPLELRRKFPLVESMELPLAVPELAGMTLIITGSGRRLRDIIQDPTANLGCLVVDKGGKTGQLFTSPRRLFANLTSELNSHLAVHRDQIASSGTNFHAVIHAQPRHLTYLSHIPSYQDQMVLSRHLLRWQPETILNLPEGIGFVPFNVPGSEALMSATLKALHQYRVIVWAKHGVVARSDTSPKRASDRIEYAETAASYEYLDLVAGGKGEGLSVDQIRAICKAFNIRQNIF
ncbi:MAG: class II aldolase/adducin family protein [Anaerolineales bacterium]|jgi:rhamnulose-1-phosphate aldolase